ncbi:hypothetical protein BH10ACT2_BH10ACT2_28890 [soil metagenome]
MNSNTDGTSPLTPAEEVYVLAVFREVARIAARSRSAFDADDIAGEVALAVVGRPATVMASYPNPVLYARQRANHAGISFDRRERSQRGEGVRLYAATDGQLHPGRRYVSSDALAAHGLPSHVTDHGAAPDEAVTERMVIGALLQRCCVGVSASDLQVLWLVDGCGYTVQEVATLRGQRRETLSRRLSRARTHMRHEASLILTPNLD